MWAESDCRTPMVCFLSMGSDPTDGVERLAKSKGIRKFFEHFASTVLLISVSLTV